MTKTITVLPGDGIGPEVVGATLEVLRAMNLGLEFEIVPLSDGGASGEVPAEVYESIIRNKVALKGPTATPSGSGHKSLNVQLRQALDLYANVRPFVTLPNVKTRWSDANPDIIVIRENTEGEYAIVEKKLRDHVNSRFLFTNAGCDRIAEFAFRYMEKYGRKKLCVGHKANIFKESHGMFRNAVYEAAKRHPLVETSDLIADNLALQLVRDPSRFDVLLLTNLLGDLFSDLVAGIVYGSLGFAAGANVGDEYAVFEPVHGTAPDIVGKGVANPSATMLSAVLMLAYIGKPDEAARLRNAIVKTLENGILTKDVDRARGVPTKEWTDAVIARL